MPRRLITVGVLIFLSLVGIALIAFLVAHPKQPPRRVWAKITRVGLNETRFRHDAVVVFATADGVTGEAIISRDAFSCKVGDKVDAVERGVALSLKPSECKAGAI